MRKTANTTPRLAIIFGSVVAVTAMLHTTTGFALGTEEQRAACTPDVFRLCSSEIPSVDRIVACLKAKKNDLSTGCKAVFNAPPERSATRSLGTPESEWCLFGRGPQASDQQDWLKWCGASAHRE
jgi:hypothetical protein